MMASRSIPLKLVRQLPAVVGEYYRKWADYMYEQVPFCLADSFIHSQAHAERVLLYAMMLGDKLMPGDAAALTILAHAAVFHDTQRQDEWADVGHGARAAAFYKEFCRTHKEVEFMPEAVYVMGYHDRDDRVGREAIQRDFSAQAERMLMLYSIFKDADALDRWRLGRRGLDINRLRSDEAVALAGFSRKLIELR